MSKQIKKWAKTLSVAGVATVAMFMLSGTAMADSGLERMTTPITEGLKSVVQVISIFSYLAGLAFGIKAALKLKEHNESKGQVPLSQPVTTAIVAAFLIALPSLLTVAAETMFGSDANLLNKDDEITDIQG